MKHIVVIGGGTGTFTVLNALKSHDVHLSAIVTMADDGKSTGGLRDQYGVLPAGDVRRALIALSPQGELLRELFAYRFDEGLLYGHNFGNLFLLALEKVTGSFSLALREASHLLNINGEVVPVTLDDIRLYAELTDGTILRGEKNIDVPHVKNRAKIQRAWLEPNPRINPSVERVLNSADLIIVGPGDLYTSIIPNFLVNGLSNSIKKSGAKKVYVANLMTKFGETHGFKALDFLTVLDQYAGANIFGHVIWNNKKPNAHTLKLYKKEQAEFISPPKEKIYGKAKFIKEKLLDKGQLIRHNQKKLAETLLKILG